MNIHEVAEKIAGSGEYVLGFDATGSHACYLVYGLLTAGEKGRVLKPGAGHEEMILAVNGTLFLSGGQVVELKAGQAVHLRGEETLLHSKRTAIDDDRAHQPLSLQPTAFSPTARQCPPARAERAPCHRRARRASSASDALT